MDARAPSTLLLLVLLLLLPLLPACGGGSTASPVTADVVDDPVDEPDEEPADDDDEEPADDGRTVGLLQKSAGVAPGYTLFAPMGSQETYLIDEDGRLVHQWTSTTTPGLSVYLLDDGSLLRTGSIARASGTGFDAGGAGGRVERLSWNGQVLWSFDYATTEHCHHHDVEMLPNGNVLMIAWERKTEAEAIASGRDPTQLSAGELWPDTVIEVEPDGAEGGAIVWRWHAWDHLIQDHDPTKANYGVVADHPGKIDLNHAASYGADWNHTNSVAYNADLDQIVLSVRSFDEIWIIDHDTTTAEAAGEAGDLLYRWGNPAAYGRAGDRMLYAQHDARWIPAGFPGSGNLLIFNNGSGRSWTSVDEIALPLLGDGTYDLPGDAAYEPDGLTWTYAAEEPTSFYARNISGAHRLENGNTLVCDGPHGRFVEVTAAGDIVWEYVNPVTRSGTLAFDEAIPTTSNGDQQNTVFRAERYAPDHPAFDGRDLTPGETIER